MTPDSLRIIDKVEGEMYHEKLLSELSAVMLAKAAEHSSEKGQGRMGWLYLLSSVDYDKRNKMALYNLISNYKTMGDVAYNALAYSELMNSKLSSTEKEQLMPKRSIDTQKILFQKTQNLIQAVPPLQNACSTRAFVTLVNTWNLLKENLLLNSLAALNDDIYHQSTAKYEQLRHSRPELSATDLNHELFKLQMKDNDAFNDINNDDDTDTTNVWSTFQNISGFGSLVSTMRRAASEFLEAHGVHPSLALQKASHPLVIWVSVHAQGTNSHHQPHVTDDALVGGVYYVRVPSSSGRLQIYDPRGKHPIRDLVDPTSHPTPPFHRSIAVRPQEGKLVLFPGWLVHSVLPSYSAEHIPIEKEYLQQIEAGSSAKYRVSISMNLKGEWQDTAGLSYTNQWCE